MRNRLLVVWGGDASLLSALCLGVVWVGQLIPTGRPTAALIGVFALLGVLLASVYVEMLSRGKLKALQPHLAPVIGVHWWGAMAGLIASMHLLSPQELGDQVIVSAIGIVMAIMVSRCVVGLKRFEDIHLLPAGTLVFFAYFRTHGALRGWPVDWDPFAITSFGLALAAMVGLATRQHQNHLVSALVRWSGVLPALAIGWAILSEQTSPTLLGAAGTVYLTLFYLSRNPSLLIVASMLYNGMLMWMWYQKGYSDPQLYLVPLGLTATWLAQLYRTSLSSNTLALLRYGSMSMAYGASFVQSALNPESALVLVGLSLAGVVMGTLLRVRSFLFMGTGFLVASVLMKLVRFGLAHPELNALYLLSCGLLILAGMVIFSLKREQIRALRLRFSSQIERWE